MWLTRISWRLCCSVAIGELYDVCFRFLTCFGICCEINTDIGCVGCHYKWNLPHTNTLLRCFTGSGKISLDWAIALNYSLIWWFAICIIQSRTYMNSRFGLCDCVICRYLCLIIRYFLWICTIAGFLQQT